MAQQEEQQAMLRQETSGAGRLLTLREVAEYLRVSEATIRRWTNAGRLRCYRLGGRTGKRLFSREQIQVFLAQFEQGSA